jgi:hypothetical protein
MATMAKSSEGPHWVSTLKSFSFLLVTTSIAAFLLFFGVDWLQGNHAYHSPVFVTNFCQGYYLSEIREHPFAFLLSISLVSSILGAAWISVVVPKTRRFHALHALVIPWIAVIAASPIWGLVWSMFRWPPGSFSDPSTMMLFYRHDIGVGISLGWLSAIISFPINILSYTAVSLLLLISKRLFVR